MYNEIIVDETNQELIQYPDKQWKHFILHTVLNKTLFRYIPLHWHHALQFMYVIHGGVNVVIADKAITINQGDGIFINSNVVHEINECVDNTEYYCWNIELPEVSVNMEFDYVMSITNFAAKLPYIYLSSDDNEELKLLEIINEAGQIYERKPTYFKLDITIRYYEALKWLMSALQQKHDYIEYYFDKRVKLLIEYLHNYAHTKITLKTLSHLIHMSESETIKLFKQHVNQTPFQYLMNVRLERSISMLYGQQTYTVTEIAMACSFSTTSYFIQIFKNKYGMTPKQMQKNANAQSEN